MGAILFVRAKSGLDAKELERRLLERRPRFLEVPGLLQNRTGEPRKGDAEDIVSCNTCISDEPRSLLHDGGKLLTSFPVCDIVRLNLQIQTLSHAVKDGRCLRPKPGDRRNDTESRIDFTCSVTERAEVPEDILSRRPGHLLV